MREKITPQELLGEVYDQIVGTQEISYQDYQYWHNLNKRVLILNDAVENSILERIVIPLQEMDKDGSNKPIKLIINTIGGSQFDGMVLCNVIDNLQTKLDIVIYGMALSLGVYIAMSGFNNPNVQKYCYPFSIGLIHNGSQQLNCTGGQLKDVQRFNDAYEQLVKNYVLSHSRISEETYDQKWNNEWYLTAQNMLEYGVVNAIISE